MKQKIGLITQGKDVFSTLYSQLKQYFEPEYEVIGYSLHDQLKPLDHVVHLFTTSYAPDIYDEVVKYAPEGVPITVLRRLFQPKKLKGLMQIPNGTNVLVINNLAGTCRDTISSLHDEKINHLTFIPYYPGCSEPTEDVHYAITSGAPDISPPPGVELVDIGIRNIHLHDLIHVGRQLRIPFEREKVFFSNFISEMMELGKDLGDSYITIEQLHHQLDSTFQAVQDPIIACNEDGILTFMNESAGTLFDVTPSSAVEKSYKVLTNYEKIEPFLTKESEENDAVVRIKQQSFILNNQQIIHNQRHLGFVCMLKDVTHIQRLEKKLRKEFTARGHTAKYTYSDIIGTSPILLETKRKAEKMARSNRNILIHGENGTGKELFAHAIHHSSERANGPFVAINCASLPDNLLESELFGYEEGAFTGAKKGGKPGMFEQADGGTIFLDEIGDISPAIQVKLLRVLQEKEVIRVGGTTVLSVSCRIISATNKHLEEMVQRGSFREDLYYRLNVLPLHVPSLQKRRQDIPFLIASYLASFTERKKISEEVTELFFTYHWPGNIRELQNVLDYALVMAEDETISIDDLPENLKSTYDNDTHDLTQEELQLLQILYHASLENKRVGRYKLARQPEVKALGLTEASLRTRFKKLEAQGYIRSGTTRQGTTLTEKGIHIIDN
ncbi:sigma 54-interacting transcriptional regulator [Bacillus tianshenii]|nr:sigma 54-interacting transcriptional regulator [Bacillus tianshenii]